MQRALKLGRKWLYLIHRWVGIGACLLFAIWFASGVVMMYVPYPALGDGERIPRLQPIDWAQVRLDPDAVLKAAGSQSFPGRLRLEMMDGRPVYRIVQGRDRQTIDASSGAPVEAVGADKASAIASGFAGAPVVRLDQIVRDQWTVAGGFDPHRPLFRARTAGPEGRDLYISPWSGEVVQETTRWERGWNWLGSIPHWIYLTFIRTDNAVWRQVILWTSGPGIVSAVTGMWIGILRLRLRRRYHKDHDVSPYRGWMKWHHIGGLVTGVTLTTWVFSGWLSVNPFEWFSRASATPAALVAYAGVEAPRFDADLARLAAASAGARQVAFRWTGGRPLALVYRSSETPAVLDARTAQRAGLSQDFLAARAAVLMPDAPLAAVQRLEAEDIYWYGHHGAVRLPVLRVRFDDPAHTWFHIDPDTGEVLGVLDDNGRAERWLFNFLHDFDLPVLLQHRPLWDLLVWGLSIGGMIISVSGVVVGWRRLRRKAVHAHTLRRKQA